MATLFSNELYELAHDVVQAAKKSGLRIVAAESCTGGLLTGLITEISGSSAVIEVGFVTYANEAKTGLLGVDEDLIGEHGAVSEQVAVAMAGGARQKAEADLSVAITGIAGPTGGSEQKPVGTVFIALSTDQETFAQRFQFNGNRTDIRLQAVEQALRLIQNQLKRSFSYVA
ncbi:MAG: CinA family protein [Rickettsiales bacterium]|jgi:nicotinamide-nucleotide amidase|nr:CinA family protein [Rickettsiales bacterium]